MAPTSRPLKTPADAAPWVRSFHGYFRSLTGISLTLGNIQQRQWKKWLDHRQTEEGVPDPFTPKELALVIAWLKNEIEFNGRNIGSLRFHNLIADGSKFEELLSFATKWAKQYGVKVADPSAPKVVKPASQKAASAEDEPMTAADRAAALADIEKLKSK